MVDRQYQLNFWLGWTFANSIGVACGWMLGEYVGQWNPIDTIIWISGELFGSMIGMGFREAGSTWMTAGPVFALTTGASVWFVILTIRQTKTSRRFWSLQAFLRRFAGMIVISLLIGASMTISLGMGEFTSKISIPVLGWAVSGIFLGAFVGGITGLVIASLLRIPLPSGKSGNFSISKQ
ncbi:MAG: hypothetical protein GY803_06640 [Chloroflexi bacterium]|nr:hypothetical protein [Chloroflexota bacterium]